MSAALDTMSAALELSQILLDLDMFGVHEHRSRWAAIQNQNHQNHVTLIQRL